MSDWARKWLPAAGLLVLLSGCATGASVKPWWTLTEANFRQLQADKASKADVRAALGSPLSEMTFAALGEDVWDYRFLNGTMTMIAAVHFDQRGGAYKYYVTEPDPAYYSTFGP